MTYKELTKQIEEIDKEMEFLYSLRESQFKGMRDEEGMIGNIINNLYARKNYLRFEAEYEPKWFVKDEVRQARKEKTDAKIH